MWRGIVAVGLALAMGWLAGAEERPAGTTLELGDGVTLEAVLIPAGAFLMGSPETEEDRRANEVQHQVAFDKPFYMGIYPVTQEQYEAMEGANRSYFKGKPDSRRRPAEGVSWDDAAAFCRTLSEKTGRNVRLPTEAEWEYAARAGTTTPFHTGGTISADQANYNGNFTYANGVKGAFREETTPVGTFPPNEWGLYDMHGNVWEWCSDGYPDEGVDDSEDESDDGAHRVWRGGSWFDPPKECRSAYRVNYLGPAFRSYNLGFRIVVE